MKSIKVSSSALCQALSKWRAVEDRYFQDPRNTAFWIEEAALNLRQALETEQGDDPHVLADISSALCYETSLSRERPAGA